MINGTYLEVALSRTSPLLWWGEKKNSRQSGGTESKEIEAEVGGQAGQQATNVDIRPFGLLLTDFMRSYRIGPIV